MNKVLLIGRLVRTPELRETKSNKKVCEFTLATNRVNGKDADFIDCMLWDKQAENLVKYQGKGSLVGVSGEIRKESYEINDKKHHKTYVLVNQIEYLSQTQKTENTPKNDSKKISKSLFHMTISLVVEWLETE